MICGNMKSRSERSDALLVAGHSFAGMSGKDIPCQMPTTDKLLYRIEENVIPTLCAEGFNNIALSAGTPSETQKTDSCFGTGILCGYMRIRLYAGLEIRSIQLPDAQEYPGATPSAGTVG